MLIYEVNLKIKNEIYESYLAWLKEHVNKMLDFAGFKHAEIALDQDESSLDYKLIRVNYHVNSTENLNHYFQTYAAVMRREGIDKFGDQFEASRRVLSIISQDYV